MVDPLLEVDEGLASPDLRLDLLARDHLTGALDEQGEEFQRLRADAHVPAVLAQLERPGVELEHAEPVAQRVIPGRFVHRTPASGGFG